MTGPSDNKEGAPTPGPGLDSPSPGTGGVNAKAAAPCPSLPLGGWACVYRGCSRGRGAKRPWTKPAAASPCSGPRWTLQHPSWARPFLPQGSEDASPPRPQFPSLNGPRGGLSSRQRNELHRAVGALRAPGRPGLSPRGSSEPRPRVGVCGGPPGVWVSASPPGRPPRPVPAPWAFAPGHLPVLQASVTRHFPAGPCSASTTPQTQGVGRAAEAGAWPGTLLALHKCSPVLSMCGVPPHSGNCSWPVLQTGELSPPPTP